ncbi:MAG: SocA family protein [Spirochaetia bacterium]|jgi:hypothetical protein|nr:SocA family protein [Spirochaetia bacterium]
MDIEKIVQVVGYVLKKNDGRLNYTKLIKLLYLADKESYKAINHSITGDRYVAMPNGPVLSRLYDLIKDRDSDAMSQCFWNGRFSRDGYDLILLSDKIPEGKLSRFEKKVLDDIEAKFHNNSFREMICFVHNPENCPEWHNPGNTSKIITEENILTSLGRTPQEISTILEESAVYKKEEELLDKLSSEI